MPSLVLLLFVLDSTRRISAHSNASVERNSAAAAAVTTASQLALDCTQLAPAAASRRLVAICLFGLNRSLRFTIASIRQFVLSPLRAACFTPEIYAHTYTLNATLRSRRSSEAAGLPIGGAEEIRALLDVRELEVTDQDGFLRSWNAADIRFHKGSLYKGDTTRNLLCQLNSLARVTQLWLPRSDLLHAVVYLRPDLRALQPIDVVALAGVRHNEIYLPYWACWRGLNDRFAFGRPAAAATYGQRIRAVERYTQKQPLHSEQLLRFALADAGVSHAFTSGQSVRVRATGIVEGKDKPMLIASAVKHDSLCTPADARPHCVKGRCDVRVNLTSQQLAAAPKHCKLIPEYGAIRRRLLVVLHGDQHLLNQHKAIGIDRAVLSPLRKACVLFHIVALFDSQAPDAKLERKKSLMNATSRASGLPLSAVLFRARSARCSWMDTAVKELLTKSSAWAHRVVIVSLKSSLASLLDVPALFLAKEDELYVSKGDLGLSRRDTAILALARTSTALRILNDFAMKVPQADVTTWLNNSNNGRGESPSHSARARRQRLPPLPDSPPPSSLLLFWQRWKVLSTPMLVRSNDDEY